MGAENYANGTFHFTDRRDATATITFNGTGIQLFGAKRGNHGNFSVVLDNMPAKTFDGNVPKGLGEFQVPLYTAHDLPMGEHMVVLRNDENGKFLDLDLAQIQIGDGIMK
jgi:hypothetical protein